MSCYSKRYDDGGDRAKVRRKQADAILQNWRNREELQNCP